MRLLLDTHALLWCAAGDTRLPLTARSVIYAPENSVFVSAASAWEIATKVRSGKLGRADAFAAEFSLRLRELRFAELPISVAHAQRAGALRGSHRDPFDRMLIAQAQSEDMALVSNERIFDAFHVRRVW